MGLFSWIADPSGDRTAARARDRGRIARGEARALRNAPRGYRNAVRAAEARANSGRAATTFLGFRVR